MERFEESQLEKFLEDFECHDYYRYGGPYIYVQNNARDLDNIVVEFEDDTKYITHIYICESKEVAREMCRLQREELKDLEVEANPNDPADKPYIPNDFMTITTARTGGADNLLIDAKDGTWDAWLGDEEDLLLYSLMGIKMDTLYLIKVLDNSAQCMLVLYVQPKSFEERECEDISFDHEKPKEKFAQDNETDLENIEIIKYHNMKRDLEAYQNLREKMLLYSVNGEDLIFNRDPGEIWEIVMKTLLN